MDNIEETLKIACAMLKVEASEWRYRQAKKEPYERTQEQHKAIAESIEGFIKSVHDRILKVPT